jgi:hypothetical protein
MVYLYFIDQKEPRHDLFIYNHVALKVDFAGKIQATDEIGAPSLFLNEEHYAYLNRQYRCGATMQGWIAVGRVGARVFGKCASNQNLLAVADSDVLPRMIAAVGINEERHRSIGALRCTAGSLDFAAFRLG